MTVTTKTAVATNGKAEHKETVRIQTVTPKMAQEWLEGNVDNRNLRESRVIHLSQILQRGEWELTNDCLVFDSDGTLLNGQHRLSAVVVTGISARFVILRGVAPRAQEVMDQGLSRTLGDQLQRRGVPYYTIVGGSLFWLHRLAYSEESGIAHYADPSLRPSLRQLLALYEKNKTLADEAGMGYKMNHALKVRSGATLALYHRLKQIDDENIDAEVDLFFDKWMTGEELKVNDPIYRLRQFCIEDAAKARTRGRAPDYRFAAYVVVAWNSWRDGFPMRQLKWVYTPTTRSSWPIPH